MSFFKWTDIVSFYNVRKLLVSYPQLLNNNSVVTYRGKCKLDGSNGAVQIKSNGEIEVQSRGRIITPQDDNMGFASFVMAQEDKWKTLHQPNKNVLIFGEFAGPGVQGRVAVSEISNKIFAIFAIIILDKQTDLIEENDIKFIEYPNEIQKIVGEIPNVYVLPWYSYEGKIFQSEIDYNLPSDKLQVEIDKINEQVSLVEKCDPWVKDNFNISGIGEGLVFYPVSHPGYKNFSNLGFKAKGELHKVVKTKAPVQVDAEVVATAAAFAELVLAPARLEQGVRAIHDGELVFDIKRVGQFIGWISKDVEKECSAELEASGLTWKQVQKSVGEYARCWYLEQTKKI